ncbi:MAG TPA: hypothetical protein VF575_04530 [Candidatus Saccharimonadales bacterium]|jgi:hypothetical protein
MINENVIYPFLALCLIFGSLYFLHRYNSDEEFRDAQYKFSSVKTARGKVVAIIVVLLALTIVFMLNRDIILNGTVAERLSLVLRLSLVAGVVVIGQKILDRKS